MKRADFNTDVWARLEEHLAGRLEVLRTQLEGELDEKGTAAVRGRIREIKEMLALPKKAAPVRVSVPSEDGTGD